MFEESRTRSWEAVLEGPYCREPFKRNEATTYRTDNEPQGVCEDTQGKECVNKLRLVVISDMPRLGDSLDGISQQTGATVLFEVKCPIQGKHSSIKDLLNAKKLAFVVCDGENYALTHAHKYYSHVQLG